MHCMLQLDSSVACGSQRRETDRPITGKHVRVLARRTDPSGGMLLTRARRGCPALPDSVRRRAITRADACSATAAIAELRARQIH